MNSKKILFLFSAILTLIFGSCGVITSYSIHYTKLYESQENEKKTLAPATEKDEFLEGLEKVVRLKKGQLIKGNIVQVTDDDVCVNIGYKSDGIIHRNELSLTDIDPKEVFHIGDEIEAEVISLNDGEGNVILSRKRVV